MDAGTLAAALAPFVPAADPKALVAAHRFLLVSPDRLAVRTARVSADSAFQTHVAGLDNWIAVNCAQLAGVVGSLPEKAPITLALDGALTWKCGGASGSLATQPAEAPKPLPRILPSFVRGSPALAALFDLGAVSCSGSHLNSVGLYGVALRRDGRSLWCLSSDNVSISAARMELPEDAGEPWQVTMAPTEAALLATLLGSPDSSLAIRGGQVQYTAPGFQAVVGLVPPLKHDVNAMFAPFSGGGTVIPLPAALVGKFVKRTAALAESKKTAAVTLVADAGLLTLQFAEQRSQTEEKFPLAEGVEVPERMQITIDAAKLAKALQHTDDIVVDHMARRCVTFRNRAQTFWYVIAGKP